MDSDFFEKITEQRIRQIARDEISGIAPNIQLHNISLQSREQKPNDGTFLPFIKWKEKSLLSRFYCHFATEGFLRKSKDNFFWPQFISIDSGAEALVWTRSSIELVYTFHKLIYKYSALPLPHDLYSLLSENVLISKRNSKKVISPNALSLETFHSRIRKNKISYPDIDDALKSVFEQ